MTIEAFMRAHIPILALGGIGELELLDKRCCAIVSPSIEPKMPIATISPLLMCFSCWTCLSFWEESDECRGVVFSLSSHPLSFSLFLFPVLIAGEIMRCILAADPTKEIFATEGLLTLGILRKPVGPLPLV